MKKIITAVFAGMIGLFSCNSTKVTSSWKTDEAAAASFKKIIVLGIIKDKDRALRQELETQLVSYLKEQGYDAHAALQEYGPKAFARSGEEAIVQKLKNSGYDAVLTTVLLDKTKEHNYNPGTVSYQPVGTYYNRFRRYYSTVYDRVYTPGYYSTSTNFFLESNLYDVNSGKLIYSVQSKAFDPSSATTLGNDYAKTIIRDMKKNGLLVK